MNPPLNNLETQMTYLPTPPAQGECRLKSRDGVPYWSCCSTKNTLNALFIAPTGCTLTPTPTGKWQTTTITDLSGPYTLSLYAPLSWSVDHVGSGHVVIYDDEAGTIIHDEFDCTFNIGVLCIQGVNYCAVSIATASADKQPNIFLNNTAGLDTAEPNEYVACSVDNAATGGTIRLVE